MSRPTYEQAREAALDDLLAMIVAGKNPLDADSPWPVEILEASVDVSVASTVTIVPAPGAGNRIRVASWDLTAAAAIGCQWKSGATAKGGVRKYAANGGHDASGSVFAPRITCGENEALTLTTDAAGQVSGSVQYFIEDV